MVPARTHPAARKSKEAYKLERELAYYMGEIEKKFNKGELSQYKFLRIELTKESARSQPPPSLR
jgi:hypothetical protein